jgi:putative membrane protein
MRPHLTGTAPLAHAGGPVAPHDLWPAWSPEPAVVCGLAVLAAAYALGARGLWRLGSRAPSGR